MTQEEISLLIKDIESDRVERKASASDGNKIRQTICAFSNDLPGHGKNGIIMIGVNDDVSFSHTPIDDKMMQVLSQMRLDGNILPLPKITVQKHEIDGNEIAIIEVSPSENLPVRYKGRVWIRVGSTLQTASAEEEKQLSERGRSKNIPFDLDTVADAGLNDLDLDFIKKTYLPCAIDPDTLKQNQRKFEDQLTSLRLIRNNKPRYGSILLFGISPLDFVPGAYIQYVRYDGLTLTDQIKSQKMLSGPLFEVLSKLDNLLEINIEESIQIEKRIEIRKPDYPINALRQLARNAVMHRTYEYSNSPVRINWFSDHIEISNPGGLYGQVNANNFGSGITDYRNPLIAECMKVMGYVQRFGMGIYIVKEELQKNGNPPPVFTFQENNFTVIIRRV